MAKEKDYRIKLKKLQNQACRLQDQPLTRPSREYLNLTVMTARGKVEQRILTLKNTK